MTKTRMFLAAAVAATLGAMAASPALARGGESGDGPIAVAIGADLRFDKGCYQPGDRLVVDWQGLTEFDGELRLVADGAETALGVTSWTDRAVMASLPGAEPGRTYAVVWPDAAGMRAKIGELRTCNGDRV